MRRTLKERSIPILIYLAVVISIVILLMPPVKKIFTDSIGRWLYILLLSFGIAFCVTPACSWVARRAGILDNPGARKVHTASTPLLGGAAVFSAFFTAIVANGLFTPKLKAILIAATTLFVVGLIDDIREIPAWLKLVVQLLCTGLVMYAGIVLKVIPDFLGFAAVSINVVLTFFWIVGITNAMNFFDGMDGLAAGLSATIAFFLGMVAFQTDQPFLGWIAAAVMGACLGFFPYNFRVKTSAAIFLGDAGSTVLGFLLACVAVYGKWSAKDPVVALVSPLLIFWVLIFDMVYITADRVQTGKVRNFQQWIDYVGKDHLHHRLANVLGGSRNSVLFIFLLSFCLGVSAIVLRYARPTDALLLIVQAIVFVGLISILERRGRRLSKNQNHHGNPDD